MRRMKNQMNAFLKVIFVLILAQIQASFSQLCNENGFRCVSCREYQLCVDDEPDGITVACPDGSFCGPNLQCGVENTCSELTCTFVGKFPDNSSCSRFYTCELDSNREWNKVDYICPGTSIFNRETLKCTSPSRYTCPLTTSNTTSTGGTSTGTSNTTEPFNSTSAVNITEAPNFSGGASTGISNTTSVINTTTISPKTTTAFNFVCTESGLFPHPMNCKIFYNCSSGLIKTEYVCPKDSFFSDILQKCSNTVFPSWCKQNLSTPKPGAGSRIYSVTSTSLICIIFVLYF